MISPGLASPDIPSGDLSARVETGLGPVHLTFIEEPPMEGLIELVDAFFARRGIECPAGDQQLARPNSDPAIRPAQPTLTTELAKQTWELETLKP